MNLKNFETEISETIMQRGKNYYADSAVQDLEEIEPDLWQAYVDGTEIYNVEIKLDGDEITHRSCNCPYHFDPICKHVAATLLAIRDQKYPNKTKKPRKKTRKKATKREQLEQILKQIKKKELKEYIRQLTRTDRKQLEQFLLQFQHYTGESGSAIQRYQNLFDAIERSHSDSDGFIGYAEARGFTVETEILLDTLHHSGLDPADKIEICFALTHQLAGIAPDIDDSDGHLTTLMDLICKQIEESYTEITPEMQKKVLQKTLKIQADKACSDYGLADDFRYLTEQWATENPTLQTLLLASLQKKMGQNSDDDWQQQSALRDQVRLLRLWDREEEAQTIIAQHLEVFEFRQQLIEQAIQSGDFSRAKQLAQRGIELAETEGYSHNVKICHQYLLDIAREEDDLTETRVQLQWLLEASGFELNHYRALKAIYMPNEWEPIRHEIYRSISKQEFWPLGKQAAILAEEGEMDALCDLVCTADSGLAGLLESYAHLLVEQFPEKVLSQYMKLIRETMSNTGRSVYEQAAAQMHQLEKLPDGKEHVQLLIAEFRTKYKNRRAMLEILEREFGAG